jgi:AbiU2
MQLTEDDIRSQKRARMGEALGDLCFLLWKELTWLHIKWEEFRTLYGTSEKEIALLNAVAPNFFGRLQEVLWQDLMLHISRLTDPPRSVGRDNLSIRRLPALIEELSLKAEIENLVAEGVARSDFARDWRNRFGALRFRSRSRSCASRACFCQPAGCEGSFSCYQKTGQRSRSALPRFIYELRALYSKPARSSCASEVHTKECPSGEEMRQF